MTEFWRKADELVRAHEPFVVVTLVSVRGGAPQEPGAKAIISAQGLHWGTVGGGKVEARAVVYSKELLSRRVLQPEYLVWNLQRDIGMTCGGEVSLLFEPMGARPWRIAVFGAGHVSQALVRVLEKLDCRVTCLDARAEWIEKFASVERVTRKCVPEPAECVKDFDSETFFVVMTQGHATDVPILTEIFKQFPDAPYVGVMGSEIKGKKMRAELRAKGISDELLNRLHCPIGLPFGGNDPSEISISVAAELLQERDRWRVSSSATELS
jgi:xanthine dehydrogenase accessory factor